MAKQMLNIKDVSSHERKTAVPYRFRCDRKRKERKKKMPLIIIAVWFFSQSCFFVWSLLQIII